MNNFENHSPAAVEDALARGRVSGDGVDRLVDAIRHGLRRYERT